MNFLSLIVFLKLINRFGKIEKQISDLWQWHADVRMTSSRRSGPLMSALPHADVSVDRSMFDYQRVNDQGSKGPTS